MIESAQTRSVDIVQRNMWIRLKEKNPHTEIAIDFRVKKSVINCL